jgi:hypothetical protein
METVELQVIFDEMVESCVVVANRCSVDLKGKVVLLQLHV